MECPKCGYKLRGSGYTYSCDQCNIKYKIDFFCEKCGEKPEMQTACGAVSFVCPVCGDLKSRTTMKKEFTVLSDEGPAYVEVRTTTEAAFKPLVAYEGWRVAFLNYCDLVKKENLTTLERHNLTDEVFVLLSGAAVLLIGGNGKKPEDIQFLWMEEKTVYNVKKHVWHHIVLQEDSTVLIVENSGTSAANSDYFELDGSGRKRYADSVSALEFSHRVKKRRHESGEG